MALVFRHSISLEVAMKSPSCPTLRNTIFILLMLLICALPVWAEEIDSSLAPFIIHYPSDVKGYSTSLEDLTMSPEMKAMTLNNLPAAKARFKDPVDAKRYAELLSLVSYVKTTLSNAQLAYDNRLFGLTLTKPTHVYISYAPTIKLTAKDPDNQSDLSSIFLYTTTPSLNELKFDIAHELAHIYQAQYFDQEFNFQKKVILASKRWFVEATADYAASKAVATSPILAGENIRMDFIQTPLTASPGPSSRHQYEAMWAIDAFIKNGKLSYHQLLQAVFDSWYTGTEGISGFTDTLTPINSALGIYGKTTLNQLYYAFAENLLVGDDSPIWHFTKAKSRKAATFSEKDPISAGIAERLSIDWDKKSEFVKTLTTPGEGTGKLVGIVSTFDTKKSATKQIKLEILGKLPDQTMLGYQILDLNGNVRQKAGLENGLKSRIITLKSHERLLLLFTNVGSDTQSVKVRMGLEASEFSVNPAKHTGNVQQNLQWQATAKNVPAEIKKLAYRIQYGDKTKAQEGVMTLTKGSGQTTFKHAFNIEGTFSGTITYYNPADKSQATLGSSTFTVTIKKPVATKPPVTTPPPTTKPATSAAPQYGWVLVSTETVTGIAPGDENYSAAVGSGTGTLKYKIWNSEKQAFEAFGSQFTWIEPPKTILPDQQVSLKISGAISENSMSYYKAYASMEMFFDSVDINPGFYGGGPVLKSKEGIGTIQVGSVPNLNSAATALTVSAAPGRGFKPADRMALIVSLYNGRSVGIKYIYAWQPIK